MKNKRIQNLKIKISRKTSVNATTSVNAIHGRLGEFDKGRLFLKKGIILPFAALIMGSIYAQSAIASVAENRNPYQGAAHSTATLSGLSTLSALEMAKQDPSLSIMVEAIEVSGLSSVLRFAGDDYTIFAPNNQAFDRLFAQTTLTKESLFANKEAVRVLLAYHIVKGDAPLYTSNLNTGKLKTYNNREITITQQGNVVDGKGRTAHIVRPNITTRNGVVHIIDNVMFPQR